ncbi:MAG: hypothetical protein R3A52_17600 [Polyangiales bacterium]
MEPRFVSVEVEPGPGCEDGLSMRFKVAGEARAVTSVPYESEEGLDGAWAVFACDDEAGEARRAATATLVDDSSDGVSWLISGGSYGLVLVHPSGVRAREPYLLLASAAL